MAEAAAATQAPATTGAPPAPPSSAGQALSTPPQVNTNTANWFGDFKNEDLRTYVQDKKFTGPEQMAERYKNLESLRGVPEERLLKLPENLDGPEAKVIWERLGTPKDANGYEFDEKGQDPQLLGWAKETFLQNNLTKTQAQSVLKSYNELMTKNLTAQQTQRTNSILQADEKLKAEWGAQYDANVNLAKQGAKVLGLDAKTLDVIEAMQGREGLYKTLKTIGVSVGESNFVDGQNSTAPEMTQEQAAAEIKTLLNDAKFVKKVARGDKEETEHWNKVNRIAAPGDKQLG